MAYILLFVALAVVFLIQTALMVVALVLLYKKGCINLNPTAWTLIIVFGQFVGSIIFLIVGLKTNNFRNYGDEYD